MAQRGPTLDEVRNPDLLYRYLTNNVRRLEETEAGLNRTQAALALMPKPPNVPEEVIKRGPALLTRLGVDLQTATAQSNISPNVPGANDDETKGFGYFSLWIESTTPNLYVCLSPEGGNAVWKLLT